MKKKTSFKKLTKEELSIRELRLERIKSAKLAVLLEQENLKKEANLEAANLERNKYFEKSTRLETIKSSKSAKRLERLKSSRSEELEELRINKIKNLDEKRKQKDKLWLKHVINMKYDQIRDMDDDKLKELKRYVNVRRLSSVKCYIDRLEAIRKIIDTVLMERIEAKNSHKEKVFESSKEFLGENTSVMTISPPKESEDFACKKAKKNPLLNMPVG